MKILALEPYYGGSHKAFLDGLAAASSHDWTLLTLPAHKWKWRMRHSAITFAEQVRDLAATGQSWDILFCSDMLNLAEFLALAPPEAGRLPSVIYFHENQLTYPVRFESERDYQFAMTNLTSALAAKAVWLNSRFHRDSFLGAMERFLKSMPDHQPLGAIKQIRAKSTVLPPGIVCPPPRPARTPGPMRILWAARWEHDKNPEDFFAALRTLKEQGIAFRLSVIGQSFRDRPEIFEQARSEFADRIDHWGYQKTRQEYEAVLSQADAIVSTTNHEFFGIGVVEAIAAGAYPVLPDRLSYPEIVEHSEKGSPEQFLYDRTVRGLAERLRELAMRREQGSLWPEDITPALLTDRFKWTNLAPLYDQALETAATSL